MDRLPAGRDRDVGALPRVEALVDGRRRSGAKNSRMSWRSTAGQTIRVHGRGSRPARRCRRARGARGARRSEAACCGRRCRGVNGGITHREAQPLALGHARAAASSSGAAPSRQTRATTVVVVAVAASGRCAPRAAAAGSRRGRRSAACALESARARRAAASVRGPRARVRRCSGAGSCSAREPSAEKMRRPPWWTAGARGPARLLARRRGRARPSSAGRRRPRRATWRARRAARTARRGRCSRAGRGTRRSSGA